MKLSQTVLPGVAAIAFAFSVAIADDPEWDPNLDVVVQIVDFSIATGETPHEVTFEVDVNDNDIVGLSFSGDWVGDGGAWASDTIMTIADGAGNSHSLGGFPAPGEPNDWDFQGGQSADDGSYAHGLGGDQWSGDGKPDPGIAHFEKGGTWTVSFTQTWGAADWTNVEIIIHKIAPPPPSATTLALNTDATCLQEGDTLTVTIDLTGDGKTEVVGGQFFLEYDTSALELSSIDPGIDPYTFEVHSKHIPPFIEYAVGIEPGGSGTTGNGTMAVLTFNVVAEELDCDASGLVAFSLGGDNKLSDDTGQPVFPALEDLGSVTLNDKEPPTIHDVPKNIVIIPSPGSCEAAVSWDPPTATDNCTPDEDILVESTHNPGDTFGVGTTTVTYTFTDACGNSDMASFDVTVEPFNEMIVSVELLGVIEDVDRCITFELSGIDNATVSEVLPFVSGLAADVIIQVPCGSYSCIAARDELHTLRSHATLETDGEGLPGSCVDSCGGLSPDGCWCDETCCGFSDCCVDKTVVCGGCVVEPGTQYLADLSANNGLVGGDLNDDGVVDILDFGVFVWQFDVTTDPNTSCDIDAQFPHADISGDGMVGLDDFTFIQINFLMTDSACPQLMVGGERPLDRVSVRQLDRMGLGHLGIADLNNDGWVDAQDIALFLSGVRP